MLKNESIFNHRVRELIEGYSIEPTKMDFVRAINYLEADPEAEIVSINDEGNIFIRWEDGQLIAFNEDGEEVETTLSKLAQRQYQTTGITYSHENIEDLLFQLEEFKKTF